MAGQVASVGNMRNTYKILLRSLKERDHHKVLGKDGRVILQLILWVQNLGAWTGFI
jgi:predicted RNA-binding protein YlqC (UPF0109 family)